MKANVQNRAEPLPSKVIWSMGKGSKCIVNHRINHDWTDVMNLSLIYRDQLKEP